MSHMKSLELVPLQITNAFLKALDVLQQAKFVHPGAVVATLQGAGDILGRVVLVLLMVLTRDCL